MDKSPFSKYILAVYFIISTMTTVGYGDVSASTFPEHVFCIVLMIFGVITFTFTSGALASILNNLDQTSANLQE